MIDLPTTTSADVARGRRRTLLVPLGSLEQHGAHLPLSTDTVIAEHVARGVAARWASCAVAPAIPIGASGEHAGFAGTLSIGTDVLSRVLVEVVRDADRDYERVVLVNGHGGNGPAIAAAQQVCGYEGRSLEVLHCHFPGADAHAGRTETSLMLHLAPELVRLERAEAGNTAPVGALLPAMRDGGVRAVSPNGVLGDPAGATAQEGERLLRALLDSVTGTAR
ncbi:mycofactocin biosynthesis peptidyl-dipeptidase MftE [Cumulibacter manganitolerans]|uniref:mycofactocin biosynthesis peptidyl-dipeptidase MftE n=1 Tax=Cumulibacter manganitolerans TaxID=1884992 RepID=UPI001294D32A|nr:mycofactocin biosynthesis peptidyl-dipeptidase MftE [Cumulibacter manganitolerans]